MGYRNLLILASIGMLLSAYHAVNGGAIEVPMQSSRAAAQADAFTAQADDPSAIFYNPAGLTQLHGTQISGGAFYLQPIFHFRGDNGSNERMDLPSVLPHVYAETDLGTERLRVGIGINDIDGINEDWGRSGPLRDIVNRAKLEVINIAPTVAYRINDHWSAGVALNIYYANLDLERNLSLGSSAIPEADFRLRGHDFAIGATPGLMYRIDAHNQVGAYYRSPFRLDFDGNAQVTSRVIPTIGPSHARETLNLPQSIGLGYAVQPCRATVIDADIIWTDWHATDKLQIRSSDPHFNGQTLPADWKSGFAFRLGGHYQLDPHWVIRAGYSYGQNAVPESTFSPLVPDSSYHLGSVGLGYTTAAWDIDLAYIYIYREQRRVHNDVNSPAVDGTWDNQIHGLMLTVTLKL